MNEKTIRTLVRYMGVDPEDLRDLDAHYKENEQERDSEINEKIARYMEDLKSILMDESASMSVRVGFALSTAAMAVALEKGVSPVQVYLDLARQCAMAERDAMFAEIGVMIVPAGDFMDAIFGTDSDPDEHDEMPSDENAPDCPECGERSFFCRYHHGWECGNRECPHVGLIDTGTE